MLLQLHSTTVECGAVFSLLKDTFKTLRNKFNQDSDRSLHWKPEIINGEIAAY